VVKAKTPYRSHELKKDNTLTIQATDLDEKREIELRKNLDELMKQPTTLLRLNTVGPVIGQEAIRKTLIAVALGMLAILGYIFFAFKRMSFAIGAVVALLHDFMVVLGTYSLISHFLGAQLDTLFVTGLLTTLTFSTHDTIVIFDKIREYRKTRMNARRSATRRYMDVFVAAERIANLLAKIPNGGIPTRMNIPKKNTMLVLGNVLIIPRTESIFVELYFKKIFPDDMNNIDLVSA
jgi:preprotein translocase SecF subunit